METNKIYQGDCLELMKQIEDKSVDLILCDLPYGTTACSWDTIIPFEPLWEQYKRIAKDNAAIVLTASQPFTSALVMSNPDMFRYSWCWVKNRTTNYLNAKKQPLRSFEDILVFYNKQCVFNPIPFSNKEYSHRSNKKSNGTKNYNIHLVKTTTISKKPISAKNVLFIATVHPDSSEYLEHPTQKPVALFEYLIKTYTNEGDLVLDNCIGSGTTAVACVNTKRNFIGFEISEEYCKIANERLTKLNDGNDGIPPKPKDLGILPTII